MQPVPPFHFPTRRPSAFEFNFGIRGKARVRVADVAESKQPDLLTVEELRAVLTRL